MPAHPRHQAPLGGALGWPLLRWPGATNDVTAAERRLLGSLFLLGAVAVALIAADHGQLTSRRIAISLEHLEYSGNLLFWSLFVVWVRRSTGLQSSRHAVALIIAMPLRIYATAGAAGERAPRFIWLLPAGYLASIYAGVRWWAIAGYRGDTTSARLLTRMAAFAAAVVVAQSIRTFWPHVAAFREIVPITMTVGFLSIATMAMRAFIHERVDGTESSDSRKPYARSALDQAAAASLLAELTLAMEGEKWYCDTNLSLPALAAKMHRSTHAISQALNQVDGRSLNEYLVAWRVGEARRLLLDPASDRFTIDALAESAGFGSRSAFYKAFKAVENMTPTEFRKRHRQSSQA
jgi:AraC-like DNA-binding protein